jgi:hypothetical protein
MLFDLENLTPGIVLKVIMPDKKEICIIVFLVTLFKIEKQKSFVHHKFLNLLVTTQENS